MERLIVVFFLMIHLPLFAQESTVRRHEMGLDVSTILVNMLGRNRDQVHLTFTYKRVLNDWALRSSFNLTFREHKTFQLQEVKDGLLWYHDDLEKSSAYTGRIGIERRIPLVGRAMLAVGVDLAYGYAPSSREVTAFSYSPASDPTQSTDYPVPGLIQVSQQPWENVKRTEHSMGLDGTAAVLYPLSDRFMVSAKFRTSLHYNLSKRQVDRFSPDESTTTRNGAMTRTIGPGLISEINIYYLLSSRSKK
jgi:hypothetical protein